MLPRPENYSVYPSVVRADKQTEISIIPNERAFLLVEGAEYTVEVIPIDFDEKDYYHTSCQDFINVIASGGMLKFKYVFEREQEHKLTLMKDDVKLATFYIYSLYDDLYELRAMKGDFHGHSFRSDGARDPSALAGYYKEQGYDFFSLTDHNRFYPGGEIDEVYNGVNTGIMRIPGEEVHTPGSTVHIVHVGGRASVAEKYVSDVEAYRENVKAYLTKVPRGVPQSLKERYAMAMWAVDNIHANGGLAIFAHPFWRPRNLVHNVCDEFATILLKSGMFDAYELVGGMGQQGVNRSIAFWGDLRADGLKISVVGSSDVHKVNNAYTFPNYFTVCFAKDSSVEAVIDAIKKGNTVAVEATGTEYDRQFRAYGTMRLVTYAQFLLTYYFPKQERLCAGVGVAMRDFAVGEASAELIELLACRVENFRQRFFGRLEPIIPSKEMLDFEDKWRSVHLEKGPVTKGSSIVPPVTRQI